ncbi:MAG: hypothetical protein Q8934_03245 [Bacillota bacterium]|nr:hypothetical protein [Bacillota bacterium]
MKKFITAFFTLCLLVGIGTGVFAKSDTIKCTVDSFKQMLPMMQEKFPDLTEKQLKEKHKACAVQMKQQPAADCSTMMGQ